jgi:hypothetical protein
VCKDCKRSFARQDSLIRHERLHTRQGCARYASPLSNAAAGSVSSESLQNVGGRHSIGNALASARTQDQALPERQSATAAGLQHVTPPAELDLELIWPDSEDLFQTIMSSDDTNQWQIPLGTSLFPPESCPRVTPRSALPAPLTTGRHQLGLYPLVGTIKPCTTLAI